jgi:predicted ferric reductase
MTSWTWALSRASGIVALVLVVLSLLWGLLFSGRATGTRPRPNWWLAMHNWLGGLSLAFIGVHLLAVFLDSSAGIGLVQILVPGTATGWVWPIGLGVVATYAFVLVSASSIGRVRRALPRRAWHLVHLVSIPAVLLTVLHAYQAGSDAAANWYTVMLSLLTGIGVYALVLRLLGVAAARRAAVSPASHPRHARLSPGSRSLVS